MTSVGEITKQKFHNFVQFCVNDIGVSAEDEANLKHADSQSATILLTAFKENISPHIDAVKRREIEVLQQAMNMKANLTPEQLERICLYMELFHELAQQLTH